MDYICVPIKWTLKEKISIHLISNNSDILNLMVNNYHPQYLIFTLALALQGNTCRTTVAIKACMNHIMQKNKIL
jgi:hypothetical protein